MFRSDLEIPAEVRITIHKIEALSLEKENSGFCPKAPPEFRGYLQNDIFRMTFSDRSLRNPTPTIHDRKLFELPFLQEVVKKSEDGKFFLSRIK
jgi:hypothetical protein